jgi:hypothetical protein
VLTQYLIFFVGSGALCFLTYWTGFGDARRESKRRIEDLLDDLDSSQDLVARLLAERSTPNLRLVRNGEFGA